MLPKVLIDKSGRSPRFVISKKLIGTTAAFARLLSEWERRRWLTFLLYHLSAGWGFLSFWSSAVVNNSNSYFLPLATHSTVVI